MLLFLVFAVVFEPHPRIQDVPQQVHVLYAGQTLEAAGAVRKQQLENFPHLFLVAGGLAQGAQRVVGPLAGILGEVVVGVQQIDVLAEVEADAPQLRRPVVFLVVEEFRHQLTEAAGYGVEVLAALGLILGQPVQTGADGTALPGPAGRCGLGGGGQQLLEPKAEEAVVVLPLVRGVVVVERDAQVYGSPFTLSVQTHPADTQYIGVIIGIKGEAKGYVTLVLSDKIRTLLKMIPLPRKMSATPDQEEEFNLYAYLKQLIDGNDVSVLLRVADEVVSVMDVLQFYMPTIKDFSTGLKLALELIRKYLPEGAFSRIYVDEQPTDSGRYIAGAVALESGDMNTAGMAMFRIKPKSEGVRAYWAQELPASMTAEEVQNYNLAAVVESDGQVVPEGKVTYTYKKPGLFSRTYDTLPAEPGEYVQTAAVGGNYSCDKISRTIVIR